MSYVQSTYAATKGGESEDVDEKRVDGPSSMSILASFDNTEGSEMRCPRISLYLAEWHLVVHLLGLLLIVTVAAFALRTTRFLDGAPTATVGAH